MKSSRTQWLMGVSAIASLVIGQSTVVHAQALPMPTDEECAQLMSDMGLDPPPADTPGDDVAPGTQTPGTPAPAPSDPGIPDDPREPGTGGPNEPNPVFTGGPVVQPMPSPTPSPIATPTPTPAPAPPPRTEGSGPNGRVTLPTGSTAKCAEGIRMAQTDRASIDRAKAARATIQAAARRHGIDWRILAAIGVRETNFRNIDSPRPDDPGWGVFQLTNQPGVSRAQARDLTFAANYAANLLADNKRLLRRRHPHFTETQLIHAMVATFNFNPSNIRGNPERIDIGTTRNNYGENVLLLANCF